MLWSDLVNRSRSLQRSLSAEEVNALRQSILDVIDDRQSHEASRSGRLDQRPVARGGAIAIDDFLIYMLDDGMRRRILERFTRVVGPLLAAGTRIDVISHSWGTVVAYEGLRELERRGLAGRVATWFTAGSALSIAPVQGRLRPENRPANGRRAPYPALVDAWINLDAKGDPVGGPLGGRFPVTREYLELDPTTCARQFWGLRDRLCPRLLFPGAQPEGEPRHLRRPHPRHGAGARGPPQRHFGCLRPSLDRDQPQWLGGRPCLREPSQLILQ